MRAKEFINENVTELYHGTLRTNVPSILANGLNPTVGEFTKSIYANKAKPLVFAADIKGSRAVYCALQSQIGMKLGKFPPSAEEIAQYGALLVISRDVNKFRQYNAKRRQGSKEPTDYTSQETIHIDKVITGKELLQWIKTHNADWGEMSCPTDIKQGVSEAPLPPDWDPEKLNLRQTFKDRLKYALDRAKRLGGGSSRVAMTIDYEGRPTALKVAKNLKGLAQNEAEIDILDDGYLGNLPIIIPLIDYDKANKRPVWLQTEIAKKVTAPTLMKMLHTPSMWLFTNKVRNIIGQRQPHEMNDEQIEAIYFKTANERWKPTKQDWDMFNEYASEVADLVSQSNLELGDLSNPANWGVYNNRPVVIDLGFTSDTKGLYGYKE